MSDLGEGTKPASTVSTAASVVAKDAITQPDPQKVDRPEVKAGDAPMQPTTADYLQTLYKLIPTEITAGYLVIYSVLNPLSQFGERGYVVTIVFLFFAILALAVINYFSFPIIRNIKRHDVRLYVSVTFLVWVLGSSVDFWIAYISATFGWQIPSGIFLGIVILWAIGSVMLLRGGGFDELKR